MEENKNEKEEKIQPENESIENETKENQKQGPLKSPNLQDNPEETKGIIKEFFNRPIDKISELTKNKGKNLITLAIIILVIWLVSIIVDNILHLASRYLFGNSGSLGYFLENVFSNIFIIFKQLLIPVLTLLILTISTYLLNTKNKKNFVTTLSTIIIAKVPVVIASVVSLLNIINSSVSKLTTPFSGFCNVISTVLLYFGTRSLFEEKDDNKFIKKFIVIMGIYYLAKFILTFFGLYI